MAVAAVVAGISVIITAAIDYDPAGWIVYAREVFGHGVLDTNTFPSWKPLPVLLIGPFTLISHGFADVYWWLWLTRTLGVLAVFGVAAAAYHLAGKWAALTAGVVMMLSPWWFVDSILGRDGPPSAALVIFALLGYYRGWTRFSGLCLVAVSLLRPEMAPFAIIYAIWAWRTRNVTLFEVILTVVVIAGLWEIPTLIHAGKSPGSLASSSGGPGTPIHAKIPFLDVFHNSGGQMREVPAFFVVVASLSTIWGLLPAGRGTRFASLWGRDNHERVLIAFAAIWVLIVASETQFLRYSGNVRYQIPGLAVWCLIVAVTAIRSGGLITIRGSNRWGVIGAAAVMILPSAITAHTWEKTSVNLIHQRESQVSSMNTELTQLKCPGYAWADSENNAYLAVITNQSLPATIAPRTVKPRFLNGKYQFVYCAPASFVPSGKA